MKKRLFFLAVAFLSISGAFATIHVVRVSDFQFSPKTVNAVVGDTILWRWVNGAHTTTSLVIPAGAPAWNKPIDAAHRRFGYRPMVAGVYNYQCNPHASVMKGKINVSPSLTAGLNSFAVNEDNAKALLNWKTVSSKDIAYFSVQRSTDAEKFTELMKINVNTSNTYRFKDHNTPGGKYIYYQVEMVDRKGNRQLSPVQMFINSNAVASKLITSLTPNPISRPGHLMLQFNADKEGSMLVKLFSQNGTFIKQAEMTANKGLNNGHFHMGDLAPGAYYIVCTLGTITEKHTVIMK
jgi:plastocyanin